MSAIPVILAAAAYVVVVLAVARGAETTALGRRLSRHPAVYGLSLMVFMTTWTFLSNVESAPTARSVFPIYLSMPLLFFLGAPLLERLVERAQAVGSASVADLMAARYGGSQGVASGATLLLAVGIVPYFGVQLGGLAKGFDALVGSGGLAFALGMGAVVVFIAVRYGLGDLYAHDARPGLVASVAAESVVKVGLFFVLAGVVVFAAFDDPGSLLRRMDAAAAARPPDPGGPLAEAVTAFSICLLTCSALVVLPRQFYVTFTQCPNPGYIRSAGRIASVACVLIHLAIQPLGHASAAILGDEGPRGAIVLSAPLALGSPVLAMMGFVAVLSAGVGMLVVETTALSTMVSNHLVVPFLRRRSASPLSSGTLIKVRYGISTSLILIGFLFHLMVGASHFMGSIGLVSFASAPIFAIPLVAGLYDRRPNKSGALLGMGLGSGAWMYTLVVPVFARSGLLPAELLEQGLGGWAALRPEALFGLEALGKVSHATFWIVASTAAGLVLGRILWPPLRAEQEETDRFVNPERFRGVASEVEVDLRARVLGILEPLFDADTAENILRRALARAGLEEGRLASGKAVLRLRSALEREIAGSLGAAMAHGVLTENWPPPELTDRATVTRDYARKLMALNLTPEEMQSRFDYQAERRRLLDEQYSNLRRRVKERDREIEERKRAEAALAALNSELGRKVEARTEALARRNEELRLIFDNARQAFFSVDAEGTMSEERSDVLARWLRIDPDQRSFVEALRGHDPELAEWFRSAFQTLSDPLVPAELALRQLPDAFSVAALDFDAEYRPIFGREDQALVILSDVTEQRRKAEVEAQQDELVALFEEAVGDPQSVRAFLKEMRTLVRELSKAPDLMSLRRALHTLKGNARLHGLAAFAEAVDRVETRAGSVPSLPVEGVEALVERWEAASSFLSRLVSQLGEAGSTGELSSWSELQAAVASERDDATIAGAARQLVGGTLGPTFRRLADEARRLARELDRVPVSVEIEGGEVGVDPRAAVPVSLSLVHLVRNAVDHGLETPSERKEARKPATAKIRLSAGSSPDTWWIEVSDDGRGIDPDALRARLGQSDAATSDILQRLFEDGVTTRDRVTDVSGRGVGLAALRNEIARFDGRVEISSQLGRGTSFRMVFPRSFGPGTS